MQRAQRTDLAEIKEILADNRLPITDIKPSIEFYILKEKDTIIVTGGLERVNDNVLIRSIAVRNQYKSKGFGRKMVSFLLNKVKDNFTSVFLLTETADEYFLKFGFIKINRDLAPASIQNSSEFRETCSDFAILMKLNLKQ